MAYIGTQPKDVRSFGKAKFDFTATQGQTAFTGADDDGKTLGFTDGQINVYVNGILMDDSDYSTSGSNTVTLSAAANANDIISVVALQTDIPNSDYVPATGGTFSGDVTVNGAFTSQGIDDNATSTAMTLDSSGNLLVGTTSTSIVGSGGLAAKPQGSGVRLDISNSGGATMLLDRRTSDGDIISFYKDGTTVGSIGVLYGDNLMITGKASGHPGLEFGGSGILPTDNTPTNSDGVFNLGSASQRFKDLYLSGGVYLGGTGSANHLDDYEEGTYTPVVDAGSASGTRSYAYQQGVYTKIGRRVFVWFDLNVSSWSGASGTFLLSLPFSSSSTSEMGQFTPWDIHNNYTGGGTPTQWIPQNSSYMYMYTWTLHSATGHNGWNLNTTGRISGSVSYTVD